jgi:hypothetical protein
LTLYLLLGLFTQIALAQNSNSGVIEGIVQDSAGGVVPDVSVDIANVTTGTHMVTKTNSDGLYTATSMLLGEYEITFTKTGFDSLVRNGVVIYVGNTTVNARMTVGRVSEQVTVTGQAPLLETETSDQATTLDTKAVESMPVVGTDWRSLNGVLPGVNAAGGQNANGQYIGFNGTQGDYTSWLFDGSPAILAQDYAPSQLYPPADAIQEVTGSTSNFSAQYGNGMSVINVITKSGTNQFHGSLFEMLQNDVFEARNYFAQGVTPLRWNNFGGSLGGPILKDKLFFFVSYMENPAVYTNPTFYTFPTAAMRRGDFSDPSFPTIYDPASLTYVNGVGTRTALPGNQVSTIDPVAAKIQSFWPVPNNLGPGGNSIYNNYYFPVKGYETNRWFEGKIDYVTNQRNRFSFSEMVQPQNRPDNSDPRCPLDCYDGIFRDQAGQLTYTSILTQNLINEARVGYAREYVREVSLSANKGYPAQLGLVNSPADIFPVINVSGVVSSELDGGTTALQAPQTELFSDVITLVRGKHVIKMGGEYDKYHINLTNWGNVNAGNFSFTGIATRNPADPASTGLGYADLLFGLPQSWNATESYEQSVHTTVGGAFVQDDYKLLPTVTLNLGLRWGPQGGWGVKNNNFAVFNPTLTNPATGTPGALAFVGTGGLDSIPNATLHAFAPRFGLAWAPRDRLAVRASYGIFNAFRTEASYIDGMVGAGDNAQGSLTTPDNINPVFSLSPNESYNQGYVQGPPAPVYPTAASRTPNLLNGQNVT